MGQQSLHHGEQGLVRDKVLSGWTTSSVTIVTVYWNSATSVAGEITTVGTTRMLESNAEVWRFYIPQQIVHIIIAPYHRATGKPTSSTYSEPHR